MSAKQPITYVDPMGQEVALPTNCVLSEAALKCLRPIYTEADREAARIEFFAKQGLTPNGEPLTLEHTDIEEATTQVVEAAATRKRNGKSETGVSIGEAAQQALGVSGISGVVPTVG